MICCCSSSLLPMTVPVLEPISGSGSACHFASGPYSKYPIPDDVLRVMEMLGKPAATEALLIPEMCDLWIGHHVRIPGGPPITGEH